MSDTPATARETAVDRRSDRELVITRSFDAPVHLVFKAWADVDVFIKWWVPKSFGITVVSYEADIRTGGSYRFVFRHPASEQPMAFFGRYLEVTPNQRLVWTNEESPDGSTTTVSFSESDGGTLVVVSDLYPSKAALDEAVASGSTGAFPEQFAALEQVLAGMSA